MVLLPWAGLGPQSSYLASYVAKIIDVLSSHPAYLWRRGLLTFCLDWSQARILLISVFQVAGITEVSHHDQPLENLLF
jgi:hypothetical protein